MSRSKSSLCLAWICWNSTAPASPLGFPYLINMWTQGLKGLDLSYSTFNFIHLVSDSWIGFPVLRAYKFNNIVAFLEPVLNSQRHCLNFSPSGFGFEFSSSLKKKSLNIISKKKSWHEFLNFWEQQHDFTWPHASHMPAADILPFISFRHIYLDR